MPPYRAGPKFFETPHAAVYVLMTLTVFISGLCFLDSNGFSATREVVYRYGAMYPAALGRHEYWRVLASGFLHADLFHLTVNMMCLVIWGAHLEKRVGAAYLIIIYVSSLVLGNVIGVNIHTTPVFIVGASGATSGVLGALLCLSILGKSDVDPNFFIYNIGLNVFVALSNSQVAWYVHLGGFAVGLIVCALLDLVEQANGYLLRCKFPEFAKVNLTVLTCAAIAWVWLDEDSAAAVWMPVIAALCFGAVRFIDRALSRDKGLATVVTALAAANGVAVVLAAALIQPLACSSPELPLATPALEGARMVFCWWPSLLAPLVGVGVIALTLWICSLEMRRGVQDIGFVAATFRAERKRRAGL
jgi:membrane associated rhomboid family serine protease